MIIITLDTSCLNPDYPELDDLAKLRVSGKIELYFEIPSEVETENWENEEKKRKMLWWKNQYATYHLTTFKAGETPPLADKRYSEILNKVREIHSPELGKTYKFENLSGKKQNSLRVDWKLCADAIFFGSQYFVTNDKEGFINQGKKEKFEKTFDIKIRFLNREFIDELKKTIVENEIKA